MRGALGNWVAAELALARRKRAQTAATRGPPPAQATRGPPHGIASGSPAVGWRGPRPPRPPREGSSPRTKKSRAESSPHSPARRRADAELHRVHHAGDDLQEPRPRV
uniref:Uncharacterized protein n=1 Tax=Equus asinus asinus TaxID=83772 RepID=A0A8C4LMW7_EQUAS